MKTVSLKDIAKIAGVSPSTVSFVLNNKAGQMRISSDVEKSVKDLARKLGYHPNQVAVSLRTGKSKIIGLVVESISGHFFAELARLIEEEAQSQGYRILYCSTENDALRGVDLIRMLSQRQVDGYLITPVAGMELAIKNLVDNNRPVVLIDSFFPSLIVPSVMVNNAGGILEGMKHLISKGYKRIGFVTIDLDLIQMHLREEAYKKALKKEKIVYRKKYISKLPYGVSKEETIDQITEFIKNARDLQAIFFATNYLGLAGLESLHNLKLRIPDDMAMVCFDDDDIFRLYPPGISSIRQPVEEIASNAINMLLDQIRSEKSAIKKTQLLLKPSFISRGSVGSLQQKKKR